MPHRGSPKVPSAEVSAGFSPLYGKKKGASAQFAGARSPLAHLRATPARLAPWAPGAKHQSESAGEKRLRPRGECAPEPLGVKTRTLQFTAKIRGGRLGVCLQRPTDIGRMLQRNDGIWPGCGKQSRCPTSR